MKDKIKFRVGDNVEHKMLGKGKIIAIGEDDFNEIVYLVKFRDMKHGHNGETPVKVLKGKIAEKNSYNCWWCPGIYLTLCEPTITEHIIRDNKIIIKLDNGKVGVARCHPDDEFDIFAGTKLAIERAYGKESKDKSERKSNQGEDTQFKVGDRVQFKSWEEMEKEFGLSSEEDIPCLYYFTKTMKHLCGTYATIVSIRDKKVELKDFTAKGNLGWIYSTDMIKPAKKELEWTFTEDEKVILRNLPEEYKWIARDRDGDLLVYKVKSEKGSICWGRRLTDFEIFCVFNHLFQSIKWEDEEPCEFRKYI